MNARFCGRILQQNPEAGIWTPEWIAGVMLQDPLNAGQGWRLPTPVQALPFDHESFGYRADNHTFSIPVKPFAHADDEGMCNWSAARYSSVILQANFEIPGNWLPEMRESLIPGALKAMQCLFSAISAVPDTEFWFPLE